MKKKILYWLFIIGLFLGLNTNGNVINANGISLKNEDASANEIIEYEENLLEKIENAYDNAENSIIYDYDGNDITLVVFEMYEKCDSNLIKYALDNINKIEVTYGANPLLRAKATKNVSFFETLTNVPGDGPVFHVSLSCDAQYSYDPDTYDIIPLSLAADNFRWISDNSNYKIISKEHWAGITGHGKVFYVTMAYDIDPKTDRDFFNLIHEFQDTAVPMS